MKYYGLGGGGGGSGGGASGFSGFSGSIGTTGLSGFSGISGTGISGFSGSNGTAGVSGFSGTNGISGFSGFSGNNGRNGVDGNNDQSEVVLGEIKMSVSVLNGNSFTETTGSGEVASSLTDGSVNLSVGGLSRAPGRIYAEGRKFYQAGQEIYLNGVNTPWRTFNEFGSDGTGGVALYDSAWWEAEFTMLENRGINHSRIWINDDPQNKGLIFSESGELLSVTPKYWEDLDDMLLRASNHGIYVLVSVMSFDHFTWNNDNSKRYHLMLGKESNVQAWADVFLVPLALRHATNFYLFGIDLGNECDNFYESQDTATPKVGGCIPVGGGSTVVNFDFRQDDYVVGQSLYVNGVNMGAVISRNSDTQVTATNAYLGSSTQFNPPNWGYLGKNPASYQRYLAICSAAIHDCADVVPLVTVGVQSIKFSTSVYGASDYYSDSALTAFTGKASSFMDFNSIHYYQWAEPFFPLMISPVAAGLSAKPSTWGELPAAWENLNGISEAGQWVFKWWPNTYYQAESIVFVVNDALNGGTTRLYRCATSGLSGPISGVAGGDIGPQGTGTGIIDGAATWNYCPNNSTFRGLHAYNAYNMIISFDGGLWVCTTAGTSSNSGGPYGVGPTFTDGTSVFTYRRPVITSELTLMEYFLASGWAGIAPWTSNAFSVNGGLYETTVQDMNIVRSWSPTTSYDVNRRIFGLGGNSNNVYRCLTAGVSDISGGPTGTGQSIADGSVIWSYAKSLLTDAPWTSFGASIKSFSDAHTSLVFPTTAVGWTNSGTAIRQSKSRGWVSPGGTIRYRLQFLSGDLQANIHQEIGAFDDLDGLFLRVAGEPGNAILSFILRQTGVDTTIPRSAWNVDKFDGTGASLATININKPQTLVVELSPEGIFPNRIGFSVDGTDYWAHQFPTGNADTLYPSNSNLVARWAIASLGLPLPLNKSSLKTIDAAANGTTSRNMTKQAFNGQFIATQSPPSSIVELAAFRIGSGKLRTKTIIPTAISILGASSGGSYLFEWWLVINPTQSNVTVWSDVPNSALQWTRSRGVGSDGIRIANGFGVNSMQEVLLDMDELRALSTTVGDVLSIQVRNISSSENYFWFSLSWNEG